MAEELQGRVDINDLELYAKSYSENEILNEIIKSIKGYKGDVNVASLSVMERLIDRGDIIPVVSSNIFPYPPAGCPDIMYIPVFKEYYSRTDWSYKDTEIRIPKTVMPGVLINIGRLRNWIEKGCPDMQGIKQLYGNVDKCLSKVIFMEIFSDKALSTIIAEEESRIEGVQVGDLTPDYMGIVTPDFERLNEDIRGSRHSLGIYRIPARFITKFGGTTKDEWGMSISPSRIWRPRKWGVEPITVDVYVSKPNYAAILRWSTPGGPIPEDKKYSEVREIVVYFTEYVGDLFEYGKELLNRILLTPSELGGLGWSGDYDIDTIISSSDSGFSGVNVQSVGKQQGGISGTFGDIVGRIQHIDKGREKAILEVAKTDEEEDEGYWRYSRWKSELGSATGEVVNEGNISVEKKGDINVE